MALCVVLAPDGTLHPTGQGLEQCAGYALVTSHEASQLAVIDRLFEKPSPEAATALVSLIAGSIISAFLLGRALGKPANLVR